MKIFYKATKPDGTDFYTGTVDYAAALTAGKPVRRKPAAEVYYTCSDLVYHAADAAAETLVGCSWPCRLFEVTGKPVAQEGHKFGFRSLRVLREIPAHLALGPNGEEVAALIAVASRITYDQAQKLAAAQAAAWDGAQAAAQAAARAAARDAARAAAWDAAWDGVGDAARAAARAAAWGAAWGAAWDAAWDAAAALVVRDRVTGNVFDTLYGPWASVMDAEIAKGETPAEPA